MNDDAQRTRWAEHLRDEAGAIARQQVAAGDTHEPVEGPLPHSRDDTAAAAHDAVLAERQRCAGLAASFASGDELLKVLPGATPQELLHAAALARHIAEAIGAAPGPGG
jgi:hypothetical protein